MRTRHSWSIWLLKTGRQRYRQKWLSWTCLVLIAHFSERLLYFIDARNFPVFNSLTKCNGEDKAQLEHNIMKLVVASLKNWRTAVWKEVAVINLFSTDCPFCLGFFSSCYSVFLNATNFPVFNSLTKRNGEDEAQLEHNIMKLVVASSCGAASHAWPRSFFSYMSWLGRD